MTQLVATDDTGNTAYVQSYQHAQKLYQLSNYPIGVMTWGIGNIGPRSVGSFISEFSRNQDTTHSALETISESLSSFLSSPYEAAFPKSSQGQRKELGIFLAGYSPSEELAEEWEFTIPGKPKPHRVRPEEEFGASWRGQAVPFTRLYKGLDPRIRQDLTQRGVAEEDIDAVKNNYTLPFVFDGMPIQDAVDFVAFVLETTINTQKFEAGMTSCGGPLWVAVITRDSFEWVRKHELRARSR